MLRNGLRPGLLSSCALLAALSAAHAQSEPPAVSPSVAPAPPAPAAEPPPPAPPSGPGIGEDANRDAAPAPATPFGISPMMSPTVGHALERFDYRATWYPDEAVAGQPTHLGYVQHDFLASVPIWQDCANEWTAHTNVRAEFFNTGAILPDTRQAFPDELWNIRFGTTYRHLFDNGWILGGTVSVGSASDKPFHSINEMTEGINGFLRVPWGERDAWLFTLSYSPTSELAIPLPGVAYLWNPSDQFQAHIGLPFQLTYRPREDLSFDFSYMLLTTVHARATYRPCREIQIYGGFDWSNESYFPTGRIDDRDRLFYYDKRLTSGVRYSLNPHASFDLSGGYVFDRFYFEGQSFSDRNQNRIDVGDGPFLSLQFQTKW